MNPFGRQVPRSQRYAFISGAVLVVLLPLLALGSTISLGRAWQLTLQWIFMGTVLVFLSFLWFAIRSTLRASEGLGTFARRTAERGLIRALFMAYQEHIARNPSLAVRITFWGGVIYAAVGGLALTGTFAQSESYLTYRILSKAFFYSDAGKFLRFGKDEAPPDTSGLAVLIYEAEDNNRTRYLESILRIAKEFKRHDVRLLVCNLPSVAGDSALTALAREAQATGIVQFAQNPLEADLPVETGIRTGVVSTGSVYEQNPRINPFSYNLVPLSPSFVCRSTRRVELVLEVFRRMRGISDTVMPVVNGHTLEFGSYRFPLTVDQYMAFALWPDYSRVRPLLVRRGLPFSVAEGIQGKPFRYFDPYVHDERERNPETLDKFADILKGKTIFLNFWNSGMGARYSWSMIWYANFTDDLLKGNVVTTFAYVHYGVTALWLVVCGLMILRFRPAAAWLLCLLAWLVLFVTVPVLFVNFGVLFEASYPLLAVFLALIVFPLVRLTHDFSLRGNVAEF